MFVVKTNQCEIKIPIEVLCKVSSLLDTWLRNTIHGYEVEFVTVSQSQICVSLIARDF